MPFLSAAFYPRAIVIVACCLLIQRTCEATAQEPDTLLYNGTKYDLLEFPLEDFLRDPNLKPPLKFVPPETCPTSCWRGYIASWEIREDDMLYLKQVRDPCNEDYGDGTTGFNNIKMPQVNGTDLLEVYWPDYFQRKEPIPAVWFTDLIRIASGDIVEYHGFTPTYEHESYLMIRKGRVHMVEAAEDQVGDILIHKGKRYDMQSLPLEHFLPRPNQTAFERPEKCADNCTRGYVATWEILVGDQDNEFDDGLYLKEIDDSCCVTNKLMGGQGVMEMYWPESSSKGEPVFASWFWGQLQMTEKGGALDGHDSFVMAIEEGKVRPALMYKDGGSKVSTCSIEIMPLNWREERRDTNFKMPFRVIKTTGKEVTFVVDQFWEKQQVDEISTAYIYSYEKQCALIGTIHKGMPDGKYYTVPCNPYRKQAQLLVSDHDETIEILPGLLGLWITKTRIHNIIASSVFITALVLAALIGAGATLGVFHARIRRSLFCGTFIFVAIVLVLLIQLDTMVENFGVAPRNDRCSNVYRNKDKYGYSFDIPCNCGEGEVLVEQWFQHSRESGDESLVRSKEYSVRQGNKFVLKTEPEIVAVGMQRQKHIKEEGAYKYS